MYKMHKVEEFISEIETIFGRIETSGHPIAEVSGQLAVKIEFPNLAIYEKVLAKLQEEYEHYNHNFELSNGINVYLLAD